MQEITKSANRYRKPTLERFGTLRQITRQNLLGHCDTSLSDAVAEHVAPCSAR